MNEKEEEAEGSRMRLSRGKNEQDSDRHGVLPMSSADGPLLMRSVAKTISWTTGTATASIRAGVSISRWGLLAGRQATYGIIGLNQTLLETVLRAAGKDVTNGTQIALRQEEAENLVDRWVTALHGALSATSILAASGFYITESAVHWGSDSVLNGLHFLNALFGDTETSRAVSTIVTLMKKELYKPGVDGTPSEVSTFNLLTTVASFLFLQRSGRRKTEIEWRDAGGDAVVWDVVIDDRGFRADVIGTRRPKLITASQSLMQSPSDAEPADEFAIIAGEVGDGMITNTMALCAQDQTSLSDDEIRKRIMEQLPSATRATITTDTMMVKTVRVMLHGSEGANIEAPPGMIMVSEHPNFDKSSEGQTVIFRTASKVQSTAEVKKTEQSQPGSDNAAEIADHEAPATAFPPLRLGPGPASRSGTDEHDDLISARDGVQHADTLSDARSAIPSVSGPVANQKKQRTAPQSIPETPPASGSRQSRLPQTSTRRERAADKVEKSDKTGVMKRALKSLSPSQSSAALNRVLPGSSRNRSNSGNAFTNSFSQNLRPLTTTKDIPRKPVFHLPTTQPTTPLMSPGRLSPTASEGQPTSYFTVHEKRRESTYSEIDTYSVHSNDSRPPSPTMSRTHLRASNSISKVKSSTEIAIHDDVDGIIEDQILHHRRSRSFVPSLYSMGTKNTEEEALVLAPKTPVPRRSIFEDNKMLMALAKDGKVPGQFPSTHLILSLRRFVRFATAAYGQQFLRWFGMSEKEEQEQSAKKDLMLHPELASFSDYIGLPPETTVASSFLDPEGLSNTYREGFSPLIHFVSVDLEAKAIVLTCRGTLGFEDLLTDMSCDYTDFYWQGHVYQVHRGIRDAARRLMHNAAKTGAMASLKEQMEQFPEFGLVFVGHSLGGAVAAVFAILLSEPSRHEPGKSDAPSFVTATKPKLLPSTAHSCTSKDSEPITLPPGRPIQVFAFGSPATVSAPLRVATRGLITSVVNANDIVPYLSIGTLHDFKAITVRLKEDFSGALDNIKQRAAIRIMQAISHFLWTGPGNPQSPAGALPPGHIAGDGLGEDNWMWNELVEMRKVMTSEKLYPPGEVFTIESTRVFDRDPDETTTGGAEQARHYTPLGRPATRIQCKWVKDVERRFAEVRFGRSMFHEHSPAAYETNLAALERAIIGDT